MGINRRYITNKVHAGFIKFIQGSYNNTKKKEKKMRCLYKKPEASYWNKFRIRTTPYRDLIWTRWTRYEHTLRRPRPVAGSIGLGRLVNWTQPPSRRVWKNKTVLGHPAVPFQNSNCTRPPRGRTVYFDFRPRPSPSVPYSIVFRTILYTVNCIILYTVQYSMLYNSVYCTLL